MAQTKINKHGLQINNLREVTSWTKGIKPYSRYCLQVGYVPSEGRIIFEEQIGTDSWVEWTDEVINIGHLTRPYTQQELADLVYDSYAAHAQTSAPKLCKWYLQEDRGVQIDETPLQARTSAEAIAEANRILDAESKHDQERTASAWIEYRPVEWEDEDNWPGATMPEPLKTIDLR